MIEHDFTQLPVIDVDDKPLGMVTSDSILRALNHFAITLNDLRVSDVYVRADQFAADEDLFELLDELRDTFAVLIVDGEKKLSGIVTSYDTTEYFRRRGEDIMLIEDIENYLKDYIRAAFTDLNGEVDLSALGMAIDEITPSNRELRKQFQRGVGQYLELQNGNQQALNQEWVESAFSSHLDHKGPPKSFEELTMYEFVELFLHGSRWSRYSSVLTLDKNAIRKLLDRVRETRNNLAHFRQETTSQQRDALRFCKDWLARYEKEILRSLMGKTIDTVADEDAIMSKSERPLTANELAPIDEEVVASDSRYARLALWLHDQLESTVRLTFQNVEEILGGHLPSFAFKHRSWWANDSVSHVQSQQWLNAGWRVSRINIAEQKVTFERIEKEWERPYIDFFSALLLELRSAANFQVRDTSPSGSRWITVAGLPEGQQEAVLSFTFVRNKQFRVELFIKTPSQERNKQIFDELFAHKDEIEAELGERLSWQRMNSLQASRIALYHEGDVTSNNSDQAVLRHWAVQAMNKFHQAMKRQFDTSFAASN